MTLANMPISACGCSMSNATGFLHRVSRTSTTRPVARPAFTNCPRNKFCTGNMRVICYQRRQSARPGPPLSGPRVVGPATAKIEGCTRFGERVATRFGRIGRNVTARIVESAAGHRCWLRSTDLAPVGPMPLLLRFGSIHGRFSLPGEVNGRDDHRLRTGPIKVNRDQDPG